MSDNQLGRILPLIMVQPTFGGFFLSVVGNALSIGVIAFAVAVGIHLAAKVVN